MVDKVALGQVFPDFFGFPLSVSFHRSKNGKKPIISNTGLCNKPKGCGAPLAFPPHKKVFLPTFR
jgi:hypothetical protein